MAQAGASRPIAKARAIYDWITTNVDYRYQPPYALLDCIPQMTATGLRADCGVFALTFVTLCRIVGVPARWQSGLYVQPNEASGHDWAQFYSPEAGWLWADCSFGSAAGAPPTHASAPTTLATSTPWRIGRQRRRLRAALPAV